MLTLKCRKKTLENKLNVRLELVKFDNYIGNLIYRVYTHIIYNQYSFAYCSSKLELIKAYNKDNIKG